MTKMERRNIELAEKISLIESEAVSYNAEFDGLITSLTLELDRVRSPQVLSLVNNFNNNPS